MTREPARKPRSTGAKGTKANSAKASAGKAGTGKTGASKASTSRASTAKAAPKKAASASRSASSSAGTRRSASGSARPRAAALAKSAPTTRMRADDPRMQAYMSGSQRSPGSADILAVAIVIFMSVLAACSEQIRGDGAKSGPTGSAGPQGEVTVQFLDVGQGDAVLVRSPEGKTMLVDGGRSAARMGELLGKAGVNKIDLMVASHADADHIAGLVEAAKVAPPTLFVNNGVAGTTQTWARLVTALQDGGTTFQKATGQTINLGSVKVQVIAPPPGMGDEQNVNSVGIRVQYGDFAALMTGDSEKKETDAWRESGVAGVRGPVQVYKSIHHGASNGDNLNWLQTVKPENVVISVGENSYGHPTEQALALYKSQGLRLYRTDLQGTVTFKGRADGTYTVETDR